jgi:hypothetical protein
MLWPTSLASRSVTCAMLIQDFAQVERPYHQVREVVLADPRRLLARRAVDAYRDGELISLRLEASTGHPRLRKTVQVELSTPYGHEDRLVVPMHWWALGATRLFPHLDAVLEFAPLGSTVTQVTLMGSYDPPFGAIGRRADTLLLHRVAEASIRSFMTRVARAIDAPIPAVRVS